jgi:hypothetical protein
MLLLRYTLHTLDNKSVRDSKRLYVIYRNTKAITSLPTRYPISTQGCKTKRKTNSSVRVQKALIRNTQHLNPYNSQTPRTTQIQNSLLSL